MSKKKNRQSILAVIKNNAFMMKKITRHTPAYFFLMTAEGIIWGAMNSAMAVFNYNLLNAVDSGSSFLQASKIIGVMAGFYLIAFAFDKWYWDYTNPIIKKKLHLRMHEELFRKALSLDLACFDDPEFYNDFVWAMNESDARAIRIIEDTGKLVNRIVASFTMFGLLFTVDPLIAVILIVSSAITIVCRMLCNKVRFNYNKESNELWRKKGYINRVYHLADFAKEIRTNHASELVMDDYDENMEKLLGLDLKYGIKYFLLYGIGWSIVANVTFFALVIYSMMMLETGAMTVGGFAASIGLIWNVRWILIDLLQRLSNYPEHSLYVEKYLEFMNYESVLSGDIADIPEFETLEFRNVSFSYEFSSHPKYKYHDDDYNPPSKEDGKDVLKNVNLKITKGEKIAIVGYNGAGKTTLIKLIMRLYDPTEGEILYNGVNIKEYEPTAYRRMIGTVFQDFKIFATTIAENVMNGEYTESDKETVTDALAAADFTEKLDTLDGGIGTILTREFDDNGTNLSGGESQKIAIARVFAGQFPIVIMDEPSSALDPMAEYKLNQSIAKNTGGKTVIFISHRLSTTRIADMIYMFDSGSLIEQGSHEELLEMGGKYAEMFRVQSQKYME